MSYPVEVLIIEIVDLPEMLVVVYYKSATDDLNEVNSLFHFLVMCIE